MDAVTTQNTERRTGKGWRSTLISLSVWCLSVASFDLIMMLVFQPPAPFSSLLELFVTLGWTYVILGLGALLIVLFVWPLSIGFGFEKSPLAVGLGVGLAAPLLLDALGLPAGMADITRNPYLAAVIVGISLATGFCAFRVVWWLERQGRNSDPLLLVLPALPVVLMEILLGLWYRIYRLGPGLSWKSMFYYLMLLVVIGATVSFVSRIHARNIFEPCLGVSTVVLVIFALGGSWWQRPRLSESKTVIGAEHRIPRFILITVDTLRRDAVAPYSSGPELTPHLASLAGESVVFRHAHAPAPWTPPSIASIMSGLAPCVHTVSRSMQVLHGSFPTLPDYFRTAGYVTAAIGSNNIISRQTKLSQAFDEYHFPHSRVERGIAARLWFEPFQHTDFTTDQITHLAEKWIQLHHDEDFFLWVHYFDPHSPYSPPPAYGPPGPAPVNIGASFDMPPVDNRTGFAPYSRNEREWIRSLYEAEVRYVDDRIGRLIATLKELDLYEDSLLVFASDHGEEFWERGWMGHGHSVYEELLAVPLMMKLPVSYGIRGAQVEETVSTVSLLPTVLDLCEIEYPAAALSAPSLAPLWNRNADSHPQPPAFATNLNFSDDREGVIFEGWKYISFNDRDLEELYRLPEDPGERMNRAPVSPDVTKRFRKMLSDHRSRSKKLRRLYGVDGNVSPQEREAVKRELKSLGYIQ